MPIILVQGEMFQQDGAAFADAVSHDRRALVLLNSPGGSVIAGLQIGTIMHIRHFASAVPEGALCASACALAWLGGQPRVMQEGAKIGFHAAFNEIDGQKIESGVGNALVGAYLNTIGLSFDTIVYIEKAHPDDITWLTQDDAREIGLDVRFVPHPVPDRPADAPTRPATPSPPGLPGELVAPQPAPAEPGTAEERARGFVQSYFAHWSESNDLALSFFRSAYANTVSFYGRQIARAVVMQGKTDFAQRWPIRVYGAAADKMRVFCEDRTGLCTVGGIVNWDCRNPVTGAHSAGAADFSLTLQAGGGQDRIVSETGNVVSRQPN